MRIAVLFFWTARWWVTPVYFSLEYMISETHDTLSLYIYIGGSLVSPLAENNGQLGSGSWDLYWGSHQASSQVWCITRMFSCQGCQSHFGAYLDADVLECRFRLLHVVLFLFSLVWTNCLNTLIPIHTWWPTCRVEPCTCAILLRHWVCAFRMETIRPMHPKWRLIQTWPSVKRKLERVPLEVYLSILPKRAWSKGIKAISR